MTDETTHVVGSLNEDSTWTSCEMYGSTWTSCEMYGHLFTEPDGTPTDRCVDCGVPAA